MLILHLAHATKLRRLKLKTTASQLQLASPIHLPELDISLSLTVEVGAALDLSWLMLQPYSRLALRIEVKTVNLEAHMHIIRQLQSLRVDKLRLHLNRGVPPNLQDMWAALHIRQHLMVWALPSAFRSASQALQALPSCPSIKIMIGFDDYVGKASPVFMTWAALTSSASCHRLFMGGHDLHVLGCSAGHPDFQGQAWQLTVCEANQVHGLHGGSEVEDFGHIIQNRAATAAGWRAGTGDGSHPGLR